MPLITPEEAEKAIYIDFEGFIRSPPMLLGILIEDNFEQVVLLQSLTKAAIAKKCRVNELSDEIRDLIQICETEQRVLVAYSEREFDAIREHCGMDISSHYVNALKIAKQWKFNVHPKAKMVDRSLKSFLKLIDYPIKKYLGKQKATKQLRDTMNMLEKRGSYEKLTPVVKNKWNKFLEHNKEDCYGMAALVKLASKEMEDEYGHNSETFHITRMLDPLFRHVIMDALKNIQTQAGRTLLSEILKGAGSKIKNKIHTKNPYYGSLHYLSSGDIIGIIDEMIEDDYLNKYTPYGSKYPLIKISRKGSEQFQKNSDLKNVIRTLRNNQ